MNADHFTPIIEATGSTARQCLTMLAIRPELDRTFEVEVQTDRKEKVVPA